MKAAQASFAQMNGKKPGVKHVSILAVWSLAAILTGCSSVSDLDVLGVFDEPTPATTTAGQAKIRASADQQSEAAKDQPTPKLSSVPERPVLPSSLESRQNVVEGLVADRENARYSDQSIRLQGGSRKTFSTTKPEPAPPPPVPEPEAVKPPPAVPTEAAAPPKINWNSERPVAEATPAAPPPPAVATTVASPPPPTVAPTAEHEVASAPVAAPAQSSVQVDLAALEGASSPSSGGAAGEQVATIHFNSSSSNLDTLDKQILAEVASAQRQTNADLLVIGHASGSTETADKVEQELSKFRISLARANRVAAQLIEMGVDPEKVQVEAAADDDPLYSESEPTGAAGNRRADIYFRQ